VPLQSQNCEFATPQGEKIIIQEPHKKNTAMMAILPLSSAEVTSRDK